MKYLLILLFSFNANALVDESRFSNLTDLSLSMDKCGYLTANKIKFREKIIKDQDEVKMTCLESKEEEVKGYLKVESDKAIEIKSIKTALDTRILTPQEQKVLFKFLLRGVK